MSRTIIHASLEFGPGAWGGITSAISLMALADSRQCDDVVVLSVAAESVVTKLGDNAKHVTISVPGYPSAGHIYRAEERLEAARRVSFAFHRVLQDHFPGGNFDLIVHNEELLELVRLVSPGNANVVYYSHGLSSQEHPHSPELHGMQKEIIETEVPIAVASDAQARLLRATTQARIVHVVPPPLRLLVDQMRSQGLVRHRSSSGPVLLLAGRLVPQKGIDLLMRALQVIDQGAVERCDVYVGHGDAAYERICRDLATRASVPVRWYSWASREQMWQSMAAASAVVVPSRFEPLGIIAAESIAVQVPVVGSAVGGLAELIDSANGTTIPCGVDGVEPLVLADYLMRTSVYSTPIDPEEALAQWSESSYHDSLSRCLTVQKGHGSCQE